jgi:hypothetical protein
MPTNQLSKIVASTDLGDATTWVGPQGTVFWDSATTTLRIGDGSTAGGVAVGSSPGYLALPSRNDTQFTIGGGGTLDGVQITTDRGTVKFGNTPECVPTGNTHFHIMKADPAQVDLFFGDDINYLVLPAGGNVVIGTSGGDYTWHFDTDGNLTFPTPNNSTVSNSVGYLGLPQHSYTNSTYNVHNYDQGKHIYLTYSPTATFNMTSNTDIPFPVGTTMMIITGGSTTASIKMTWANGGDSDQIIQAVTGTVVDGSNDSSGSFTLAPYGMATLVKIGDTVWMISGAGLS